MPQMDRVAEIDADPATARVYAEGWQSWSPTRTYRWGEASYQPEGRWQHAMRYRPGRDAPVGTIGAEGLVVVDPGADGEVVAYVTESLTRVPSLTARWGENSIVVDADGPVAEVRGPDLGSTLAAVGDRLAQGPLRPAPRVWCSWYQYFEAVTAGDIRTDLASMEALGLPYDVVQIDDGWSHGFGEYQRPRTEFGDVGTLVRDIRSTGRDAGLWLAPFIVGRDSSVARDHPDWLLGYAGFNWGTDQVGLDVTHPAVRAYLQEQIETVAGLGVTYLKLDFLYGGALPGARHDGSTPVEAYRSGMAWIREVAGPDVYVVGCGAPMLPSIGLVDAMRVSPDTFHEGGEDGSRGLRGAMSCASRVWQQGRLWVNDPDCTVARPSYTLREQWAEICTAFGGMRSTSDRLGDLDAWGLERTRALLAPVAREPWQADPRGIEAGITGGDKHRHL